METSLRFFIITIWATAIFQVSFNFPLGKLISLFSDQQSSRYLTALSFTVVATTLYFLVSARLIFRRFGNDGKAFNLPYRGEVLIHVVSLFFASGAIAFAISVGRDASESDSLRTFEYFSYLGMGIISTTWIGLFKIVVDGPVKLQRDIDIELRGRTFMKAPDWLDRKPSRDE